MQSLPHIEPASAIVALARTDGLIRLYRDNGTGLNADTAIAGLALALDGQVKP